MLFFTTLYRVIRASFRHFTRNFWHALAAILVMALTFYSVSYFGVVAFRYQETLQSLQKRPQIVAFFSDEASEEYILQLEKELKASGKVASISYISKPQALEIYREQHSSEPELLEFVTAEILPASLEITTTELVHQKEIARMLAADSRVEKVIFHQELVERFQQLSRNTQAEGIIWAGSLILVSILTILAVVSMHITTFGKEIEIMRLVGASSWFIRWSFVLDGAVYGILAAAISTGILYGMPYFRQVTFGPPTLVFPEISVFPVPQQLLCQLWLLTTGLGVLLGVFGSLVAIWRHLQV